MYHPERIAEWMRDKFSVCPIYLEISLTNACNHKCSFCALDYCGTRKKKTHLDINLIRKIIPDLKKRKIKSILLAGAGEPVMHPDFPEITHIIKQNGIDCAVSTNMALYSKEILKETLSNLVWIRASLDAGNSKVYASVHNAAESDFYKTLENIETAVKLKKDKSLNTAIGVQFLLLDDNADSLFEGIDLLKKTGADYLSVKPFNTHQKSGRKCSVKKLDLKYITELKHKIEKYDSGNLNVIFRAKSFERVSDGKREYKSCFGISFLTFVSEDGGVYPCPAHFEEEGFSYGNLYKKSFEEIWLGAQRRKIFDIHVNQFCERLSRFCRPTCRLNSINQYLWKLENADAHKNFI